MNATGKRLISAILRTILQVSIVAFAFVALETIYDLIGPDGFQIIMGFALIVFLIVMNYDITRPNR